MLKAFTPDVEKLLVKTEDKVFLVDKFQNTQAAKNRKTKSTLISSKLKKSKKLFEISPDKVRYETFQEINALWNEYIGELIGPEYSN